MYLSLEIQISKIYLWKKDKLYLGDKIQLYFGRIVLIIFNLKQYIFKNFLNHTVITVTNFI